MRSIYIYTFCSKSYVCIDDYYIYNYYIYDYYIYDYYIYDYYINEFYIYDYHIYDYYIYDYYIYDYYIYKYSFDNILFLVSLTLFCLNNFYNCLLAFTIKRDVYE